MRSRATPRVVALPGSGRGAVASLRIATLLSVLSSLACSAGARVSAETTSPPAPVDAPLVAAQPGAWFDASGTLTVVGAGRRLRLILSAPISACESAQRGDGEPAEIAERSSLPFHVLAEACRDARPSILLPEESDTASPAELERSYHEVARCAGADLALVDGWRPDVVESVDPCPLALGLGWRLPTAQELSGLSRDDRKAIASALFDTERPGAFDGLLLYARARGGGLTLVTLSPSASDQAPPIPTQRRDQPLFGAALRCVRDAVGAAPLLPVLPHAAQCLREQRKRREQLASSAAPTPPELQKLRSWVNGAELQPNVARLPRQLEELAQLLESPVIERLAREAREERALTERYAELAEGLDDPAVSAAERQRRRDEFDHLRRRLGGRIVEAAEGASLGRAHLAALLAKLTALLEAAANAERGKKKGPQLSYEPLLSRLRELGASARP